jgi:hypothetical protein
MPDGCIHRELTEDRFAPADERPCSASAMTTDHDGLLLDANVPSGSNNPREDEERLCESAM